MDHIAIGLASVAVLGIAAQWLGWRLKLPAILLLLLFGFAAGPEVLDLVRPKEMFGPLLQPFYAFCVAILLFEGGLTLRLPELGDRLRTVLKLVTLGAGITWGLAALAAHLVLGLAWPLAVLFGSILTVTGPTVVGPILRQVRPKGDAGPILKWEGILIDPIGAVLAVLVFQGITNATGVGAALFGIASTLWWGGLFGFGAALLLVLLLARFWVPDHLHSPVALALAVGSYELTNHFQPEAGLLTVTLMGTVLANQKRVDVGHILEFKENLRVLIISALFILFAAGVRTESLAVFDGRVVLFIALLILVIRPVSVLACTPRLAGRDRAFLACLAPRGVVAAAVTQVFATPLGAGELVPIVFFVILGTVAIYGLAAAPLAYRLGLAEARQQGVLIVGGHQLGRELAKVLMAAGFAVRIVDTNSRLARTARMEGIPVFLGNAISDQADDELDLAGIGRLFALTANDEVNALCALHYIHLFGRGEVYQLPCSKGSVPRGRVLFGETPTFRVMRERLNAGATIKATNLTDQFGLTEWIEEHGPAALPLAVVEDGELTVATAKMPLDPEPGQTLIGLV